MSKQVIEYSNFSGGEYGLIEAWRAPKNSFTATNMLVYKTGELGVRPGLRDVTPSGVVAGLVWGMGPIPRLTGDFLWYGQSDKVRKFNANSTPSGHATFATSITGGAPTDPSEVGRYQTGFTFYIVMQTGGGLYSCDGTTLTKLSGTPSSNMVGLYGDRLVIAQPNDTLRYNGVTAGVSDFTSWPAANIIPVGDDTPLTGIHPQRDHLSLLKAVGGNYVVSGNLGVNEVLRQANFLNGAEIQQNSALAYDERVWFMSPDTDFPTWWNGSTTESLWHLSMPFNDGASTHIEPMRVVDVGGLIVIGGLDFGASTRTGWTLVYSNGVWTKHHFDARFDILGSSHADAYASDPALGIDGTHSHEAGFYVMCDNGDSTTNQATHVPVFYGWSPLLDRPGSETLLSSTVPERAGDNSSAQVSGDVTFPEYHDPDGNEFLVKSVEVDFRAWNTGGSLTNHFDLTVDALRTFDNSSPIVSSKLSWDEAGAISSTGGTIKRQVFSFGDQGYGNAYQLHFTNCRGIAFQRIHVVLSLRPARGVG